MRLSLFALKQCIIKQLLDLVFVISEIIKVSVSVISLNLRLQLIILTSTLIIPDITKTSSNNCLISPPFIFVTIFNKFVYSQKLSFVEKHTFFKIIHHLFIFRFLSFSDQKYQNSSYYNCCFVSFSCWKSLIPQK